MRLLARNQRRVWYCLNQGRTPITDSNGNETGEYEVAYSEPKQLMANVTAASGSAEQEQFGIGIQYDKVLQVSGTTCPIDEHSLLFIDTEPPTGAENPADSADYIVKRVSVSLNHTSIAAARVTGNA